MSAPASERRPSIAQLLVLLLLLFLLAGVILRQVEQNRRMAREKAAEQERAVRQSRIAMADRAAAKARRKAALISDPLSVAKEDAKSVVNVYQALRSAQAAVDHDPSAEALRYRAQAYQRLSRYEEALSDVDRVLVLEPKGIEDLLTRAKLLAWLGRGEQALRDLDEVLLREPDRFSALWLRAKTRKRLNDLEGALADGTAALSCYGRGYLRADLYRFRAQTLLDLGRPRAALETIDEGEAYLQASDPKLLRALRQEAELALLGKTPEAPEANANGPDPKARPAANPDDGGR